MSDLEYLLLQGFSVSAKFKGYDGFRLQPGVGTIPGVYAVSATVAIERTDMRLQQEATADVTGFGEEMNDASHDALKIAVVRLREKLERVYA